MSARKVTCHHCEGWGCTHCELERRAAAGGEQGPTPVELELEQLRAEVRKLKAELLDTTWQDHADAWQVRCLKAEAALEECREDRDEAQRAAAWAQKERDAALAQLALLSKGGAA